MAILLNCEIHFAKLDPKRPSDKYNKKNPTWEVQLRTTDKAQKDEWTALGLKVTPHREDEDGPLLYWRTNLRKKSIKSDGSPGQPPEVVDGDMEDVDPNTIGNGSIANVRIFQYTFENDGKAGVASVLMGLQLTTHILYTPKPREDGFAKTTTKRVQKDPEDAADSASGEEGFGKAKTQTPATGSSSNAPGEIF